MDPVNSNRNVVIVFLCNLFGLTSADEVLADLTANIYTMARPAVSSEISDPKLVTAIEKGLWNLGVVVF